jgi:hypothetical protein
MLPIIGDIIGSGVKAGVSGLFGLIKRKIQKRREKKRAKKSACAGGVCALEKPGQSGQPGQGGRFNGNQLAPGFQVSPNKFNQGQQGALGNLLERGQAGLEDPYAGFEPIETYAQNKFKRESIPGLAERFTSLGGSDTRPGRDLENQLYGAQSEFDQGLAAMRAQHGQQGIQNSLQMLQLGLTPQTEQVFVSPNQNSTSVQSRSPSIGSQFASSVGNSLGSYFANGGDFGYSARKEKQKEQQAGSFASKALNKDNVAKLAALFSRQKK